MQARSPALFPKPAPDGLGPYASDQLAVPRRRGVVLILVIGM